MGEVLQLKETNLAFFLDGKLKINDIQTLSRWVNNLMEDEWKMAEKGIKTLAEARKVVTTILEAEHKYRRQLVEA